MHNSYRSGIKSAQILVPGVGATFPYPTGLLQKSLVNASPAALPMVGRREAALTAAVGAGNHFGVAIATPVVLLGLDCGAAAAKVVGVMVVAPLMLIS